MDKPRDWATLKQDAVLLSQELEQAQRFYRLLSGMREGLVQAVMETAALLDGREEMVQALDAQIEERNKALAVLSAQLAGEELLARSAIEGLARHQADKQRQTQESLRDLDRALQQRRSDARTAEGRLEESLQAKRRACEEAMAAMEGALHDAQVRCAAEVAQLEEKTTQARALLAQLVSLREGG